MHRNPEEIKTVKSMLTELENSLKTTELDGKRMNNKLHFTFYFKCKYRIHSIDRNFISITQKHEILV